jgi:hypothetical protein
VVERLEAPPPRWDDDILREWVRVVAVDEERAIAGVFKFARSNPHPQVAGSERGGIVRGRGRTQVDEDESALSIANGDTKHSVSSLPRYIVPASRDTGAQRLMLTKKNKGE